MAQLTCSASSISFKSSVGTTQALRATVRGPALSCPPPCTAALRRWGAQRARIPLPCTQAARAAPRSSIMPLVENRVAVSGGRWRRRESSCCPLLPCLVPAALLQACMHAGALGQQAAPSRPAGLTHVCARALAPARRRPRPRLCSSLARLPVQIRFTRVGRKKLPFYRIVAVDSRVRRDGKPLEFLGW